MSCLYGGSATRVPAGAGVRYRRRSAEAERRDDRQHDRGEQREGSAGDGGAGGHRRRVSRPVGRARSLPLLVLSPEPVQRGLTAGLVTDLEQDLGREAIELGCPRVYAHRVRGIPHSLLEQSGELGRGTPTR